MLTDLQAAGLRVEGGEREAFDDDAELRAEALVELRLLVLPLRVR